MVLLRRAALGLGCAAALGAVGLANRSRAEEEPRVVPVPAADAAAGGSGRAVLAGGCFWGVQGVFQHVRGVTGAVSGYAGGSRADAAYQAVSSGRTGHAEAVEVSFGTLLQVFFSVAHDPTQLNRQGPDSGTQYRSAIFPADADQERVSRAYLVQLDAARVFPAPVVTRVEPGQAFFPAEEYHQDFMERHPGHPYIVANDAPKLGALRRLLPQLHRERPVLAAAAG